jgi:hypothetical protein
VIFGARRGEAASTLILGVDSRSRVKELRDGALAPICVARPVA